MNPAQEYRIKFGKGLSICNRLISYKVRSSTVVNNADGSYPPQPRTHESSKNIFIGLLISERVDLPVSEFENGQNNNIWTE